MTGNLRDPEEFRNAADAGNVPDGLLEMLGVPDAGKAKRLQFRQATAELLEHGEVVDGQLDTMLARASAETPLAPSEGWMASSGNSCRDSTGSAAWVAVEDGGIYFPASLPAQNEFFQWYMAI